MTIERGHPVGFAGGSAARRSAGRRSCRRGGFTLAELMVSVGVLALMLVMVGMIFSTATEASGKATATQDIFANIRVLERQLRKDLKGVKDDATMAIWHQLVDVDPDPTVQDYVRADRLVFFATGNFNTINQVDGTGELISSSTARIFYGQADDFDSVAPQYRTLTRRAKLQVAQGALTQPPDTYEADSDRVDSTAPALWDGNDDLYDNWEYEFKTLHDWENTQLYPVGEYFTPTVVTSHADYYEVGMLTDNASPVSWIRRPRITVADDPADSQGLHMYFLPGCAEFKVQRWIETNPYDGSKLTDGGRWWPEEDIDPVNHPVSDFDIYRGDTSVPAPYRQLNNSSGPHDYFVTSFSTDTDGNIRTYFVGPKPEGTGAGVTTTDVGTAPYGYTPYYNGTDGPWLYFEEVPKAIKVTVTLYDYNRRVEQGITTTMVFPLR